MKKALLIFISFLLLTGCTSKAVPDESDVAFQSIEEYIEAIHDEWPGQNKFFFQAGTADYSIEGYKLVADETGDPVTFENASFWVYAENGYESNIDGSTSFYLRGIEGPRDAVYGPFEGNLVELLR